MIPAATPRNIAGNVGPPRKLPSDRRVGDALADDQQRQRAHRVGPGPGHEARQVVLAGEQDVVDRVPGRRRVDERENADQQADDGKHDQWSMVGDPERLQPTAHDEPGAGRDHDPEHDRPAEVADVRSGRTSTAGSASSA